MEIRGYMLKVDWDGETLRARGTNKAAQFGLMGPGGGDGDLVLTRADMAEVTFAGANPLINGRVVIRTHAGKRHQLTFRRKQSEPFVQLARELGAV